MKKEDFLICVLFQSRKVFKKDMRCILELMFSKFIKLHHACLAVPGAIAALKITGIYEKISYCYFSLNVERS